METSVAKNPFVCGFVLTFNIRKKELWKEHSTVEFNLVRSMCMVFLLVGATGVMLWSCPVLFGDSSDICIVRTEEGAPAFGQQQIHLMLRWRDTTWKALIPWDDWAVHKAVGAAAVPCHTRAGHPAAGTLGKVFSATISFQCHKFLSPANFPMFPVTAIVGKQFIPFLLTCYPDTRGWCGVFSNLFLDKSLKLSVWFILFLWSARSALNSSHYSAQ